MNVGFAVRNHDKKIVLKSFLYEFAQTCFRPHRRSTPNRYPGLQVSSIVVLITIVTCLRVTLAGMDNGKEQLHISDEF